MSRRDLKIAKRLRLGETAASVADRYGITDRAVRKIRAAVAGPGKPGRKSTGAVTHNTARTRRRQRQPTTKGHTRKGPP